ncbi:MAG: glycosyltransferase 25 family protein [Chitinophagaceae bacterium]|nr:glycosyltransferase 25 family protein [Chitinophagaceae bacterium]
MLHSTINKAFCINLYSRPDKWEGSSKQFAVEGLNVERFNAIQGNQFVTKYPAKPGNCGCNLSHYLIIQSALIMGFKAIMVFEDDVMIAKGFVEKVDKCLADIPEGWDMLMLGGSNIKKPTPVTGNIYKVAKTFCTHAYIMRNTLFELSLERMKHFDQPFDCIFTEFQQTHNVYITNPQLAGQIPGYSDIEEKVMSYDLRN